MSVVADSFSFMTMLFSTGDLRSTLWAHILGLAGAAVDQQLISIRAVCQTFQRLSLSKEFWHHACIDVSRLGVHTLQYWKRFFSGWAWAADLKYELNPFREVRYHVSRVRRGEQNIETVGSPFVEMQLLEMSLGQSPYSTTSHVGLLPLILSARGPTFSVQIVATLCHINVGATTQCPQLLQELRGPVEHRWSGVHVVLLYGQHDELGFCDTGAGICLGPLGSMDVARVRRHHHGELELQRNDIVTLTLLDGLSICSTDLEICVNGMVLGQASCSIREGEVVYPVIVESVDDHEAEADRFMRIV